MKLKTLIAAILIAVPLFAQQVGKAVPSGMTHQGSFDLDAQKDIAANYASLSQANIYTGNQTYSGTLQATSAILTATSSLTLGTAGTSVGNIIFKNATSGSITLAPVSGALGSVTLTLPAATDTVAAIAATQTLTNKTLTAPVINGATSASGNFDLSGSSGTFKTSTGAVTIGSGAVTVSGVAGFTAGGASGATANFAAVAAPTAAVAGDIWNDSTRKTIMISPAAANPIAVGGMLASLPVQAAITTVTTIQTMNGTTAISIPAGAMNVVGKTLRIKGKFVFSNGVDTPALTVTLKFGAVTLAAPVSAANANSNSSSPADFEFLVTTSSVGASGTVEAHGLLRENVASAVAGAAVSTYPDTVTAASSAIDLTGAVSVTIGLTSTGGTVTTATLRQCTVEILN